MHGFFYLGIFNLKNGLPLVEFTDLTFRKSHLQINFVKILLEQGISFKDMEMAQETSSLQLKLEDSPFPFVFYFFKGRQILLMVVTDKYNKKIFSIMEKIVIEFELDNDILGENHASKDQILKSTIQNVAHNVFKYFIPEFLIPEKNPHLSPGQFESIFKENSAISEIYSMVDGSWALDEILERIEYDSDKQKEAFFTLWVNELIYFRFRYSDWDKFMWVTDNATYLEDGSPKNISLINKFNTNKIIRIIQLSQEEITYKGILSHINITRTKLDKYLTELIRLDILHKKPLIPIFSHISEDIVPLLSIQGFSNEDFDIFEKLQQILDGNMCLDDVALEIQRDSVLIKKLLDKYNAAIKIIN